MPKKAPGFEEERQAALTGVVGFHDVSQDVAGGRLKIGPGGRVVIPVEMRQAMGVAEGDTLLATLIDGELRLLSTKGAIRRAQAMVRAAIPAGGGSVVDELLADRRREMERANERYK